MKKDFKKELKEFYKVGAKKVVIVDVPEMNFLIFEGEGDPGTAQIYKEGVEALFALSYTIKFAIKHGDSGIDYGVMPLEGLWWADDMEAFREGRKNEWKWKMMIMQPDFVTSELVRQMKEKVIQKKGIALVNEISFDSFKEGKAAQIMHVGPFSEEGPTIEKLHGFIEEEGLSIEGLHHEIYLSDIRRAAPEKWKTIIRQPVK